MNINNTKRIGIAFILILTIIVYTPVFQANFIGFDDPIYITKNDWVKAGLTWKGIQWAFTHFYSGNWHPLTWLSHMIDCEIYGMNASGHHVSNLIFHLMNSILLYLFFFQATGEQYKSLAMGLFFALHPLHVESVAWISERKDVLSTFFGLLSLLAYLRYINNYEKKYYYYMLVGLCLSLMSKSMLVTMPFLLMILDVWPLKRTDRNRIKDKLPVFFLVIPFCIITCFAQHDGQSISSFSDVSLSDRIFNAWISSATYIYKTILPTHLAFLYPYPEQHNILLAILCLLILLLIFITGFCVFSHMPYLITGFIWFIVALLPVIGIIQIGTQSMADRYTYIPHIGLFWAIIWTLSRLSKKNYYHQILIIVFCFVLMGFACKTYLQAKCWKNGQTLFKQAIKNTKNNYIAHNNLGGCLTNPMEQLEQFNRSIEIYPKYITGRINKGNCLLSMGKIKEAAMIFQTILKDEPNHIQANLALAELYYQQHQIKKALQCCHNALKNAGDSGYIYFKIAQIFIESGKLTEAQFFYRNALRVNPFSSVLHKEYGYLLVLLKQYPKAMSHFKQTVKLNPNDAKAHHFLSIIYTRDNQINKAYYHAKIAQNLAHEDNEISKHFQKVKEKLK